MISDYEGRRSGPEKAQDQGPSTSAEEDEWEFGSSDEDEQMLPPTAIGPEKGESIMAVHSRSELSEFVLTNRSN